MKRQKSTSRNRANWRLILSISKTHIWTRKKQSLIAALGVTFGIGTYVIMMSFMHGLNDLLDGLILNRTPHIHLYNELKPSNKQPLDLDENYNGKTIFVQSIKPKNAQVRIHNALPILSFLNNQPYVKGATPQIKAQAYYLAGSNQLNGSLTGIDVMKEGNLYNLGDYIIDGTLENLAQNEKGILLGAGVAKKLSVRVGDVVQVSSIKGDVMPLKVVGFYQSGMAEIDNIQSYVNLKVAQRLTGQSND